MASHEKSAARLDDMSLAVVYAPRQHTERADRNGQPVSRLNKLVLLAVYEPEQVRRGDVLARRF